MHAARWKYKTQKNRHLGTIAQLCCTISLQLRHVSTIRKILVILQYLLHVFPQYGELRPTNEWDLFGNLGNPSKFQWVLRLGFVTAATSLTGGTMFGLLPGWYTVYIFGGSCPLTEFCELQNSLCVQVLHSSILVVLLHGTWAAVISQTL